MTKKVMVALGIFTMLTGLFALNQGNSLWSFFLSQSPQSAILCGVLGLSLIAYALLPTLRTATIAKLYGGFGLSLMLLTLIAVFTSHVALINAFVYLLVGDFITLGSLVLPQTKQARSFTWHATHLKSATVSAIRHAH